MRPPPPAPPTWPGLAYPPPCAEMMPFPIIRSATATTDPPEPPPPLPSGEASPSATMRPVVAMKRLPPTAAAVEASATVAVTVATSTRTTPPPRPPREVGTPPTMPAPPPDPSMLGAATVPYVTSKAPSNASAERSAPLVPRTLRQAVGSRLHAGFAEHDRPPVPPWDAPVPASDTSGQSPLRDTAERPAPGPDDARSP